MKDNTWARLLAYVTGLVNQELLLRNEYLAAENRILRAHLPARLRLTDPERSTLAEIAKRLGVEIGFETPSWDVITAGSWGGRWDFSVGSMTITSPRQEVLDFSDPYYYTPAQMAVPTSMSKPS